MFLVVWRNPATGLQRVVQFETRDEADAYVEWRVRKYGSFLGFVRPVVEEVEVA